MNNNKNGLDERQRERRNSIGNQMFMLLFYALFLNGGLYGAGIKWLSYPAIPTFNQIVAENLGYSDPVAMGQGLYRQISASNPANCYIRIYIDPDSGQVYTAILDGIKNEYYAKVPETCPVW